MKVRRAAVSDCSTLSSLHVSLFYNIPANFPWKHLAETASAAGIEKDKDAVRAGLTWWINNGIVEGHVTKLKLIKRQGYGRAGFPLLRKRVLHAM